MIKRVPASRRVVISSKDSASAPRVNVERVVRWVEKAPREDRLRILDELRDVFLERIRDDGGPPMDEEAVAPSTSSHEPGFWPAFAVVIFFSDMPKMERKMLKFRTTRDTVAVVEHTLCIRELWVEGRRMSWPVWDAILCMWLGVPRTWFGMTFWPQRKLVGGGLPWPVRLDPVRQRMRRAAADGKARRTSKLSKADFNRKVERQEIDPRRLEQIQELIAKM